MAKMNGNGKVTAEKVRKDVQSVFTMMEQEAPKMGADAPVKVKSAPKPKKGY